MLRHTRLDVSAPIMPQASRNPFGCAAYGAEPFRSEVRANTVKASLELKSIAKGCYVDRMSSAQVDDRRLDLCGQLRGAMLIACLRCTPPLHWRKSFAFTPARTASQTLEHVNESSNPRAPTGSSIGLSRLK